MEVPLSQDANEQLLGEHTQTRRRMTHEASGWWERSERREEVGAISYPRLRPVPYFHRNAAPRTGNVVRGSASESEQEAARAPVPQVPAASR